MLSPEQGWDNPEDDDGAELDLDLGSPADLASVNATRPSKRLKRVGLEGDHPMRRLRSRLTVRHHLARGVLRVDDPIPVREYERKTKQARDDLAQLRPILLAARDAVLNSEQSSPWHTDALADIDPDVLFVLRHEWDSVAEAWTEAHRNHGRRKSFTESSRDDGTDDGESGKVEWQGLSEQDATKRDHLANTPWHISWEYQATGSPNGRPPAKPPSASDLTRVICWLESEVGKPIADIR